METIHGYQRRCSVLCALTVLACGGAAAWQPRQWAEPRPLVEIDTQCNDKAPFLSFDGLTLYFSRNECAGLAYTRIFQATRPTSDGTFGPAVEIGSLCQAGSHSDFPWVSADNLRMYYYCAGSAGRRLKLSRRNAVSESWPPGSDIVELNALGDIANPTLTEDELTIVFSGYGLDGGHGTWDLWIAGRSNKNLPFGSVVNLGAANTAAWELHPSITADGLTVYFTSTRNGPAQIFMSRRRSQEEGFGLARHVAELDTKGGGSIYPFESADGSRIYFGRHPDGGTIDLYVADVLPAWYVDATGGRDTNSGLSPRMAFATIQRAIDVANDGDIISVCPGLYREELDFLGKAVTVQSVGDAAVLEAPGRFAVTFCMGEGPDTILRNFVIANSYMGILCVRSCPTITNVTVTGNVYGAEAYGPPAAAARPGISNSIFWGNAESDLYGCQATYSCIERGGGGQGNISRDPLFVDVENGDYHVRSARGRYWPEHDVWVLDDVTSPCIDAGDPTADFSAERSPNGGRLNVGAHGGTAYAGMSDAPFTGDMNGDGVFDADDYEAFMDLWQHRTPSEPPEPPVPPRR